MIDSQTQEAAAQKVREVLNQFNIALRVASEVKLKVDVDVQRYYALGDGHLTWLEVSVWKEL